jgi:bifunctional UDP-N-acetylglucosamine pyrophosphorylase/glucosamine-1-phosphate N-acetyltransferase
MQAVLMVAGKSTRTYPLTLTRPNPLLPILNRPMIEHSLDQMVGLFDQVILIVGYRQEMIHGRLGESYRGIRLIYQEQKEQLGTGHAVLQAEPHIRGRFVAMNGDDLFSRVDLEKLLQVENGALVKRVPDPSLYGVYQVNAQGLVLDLVEKPDRDLGDLANIGCYIFLPEVFDKLRKAPLSVRGEIEIVDGILGIAREKPFYTVPISSFWLPTGYAWDLLEHQDFFLQDLQNDNRKTTTAGARLQGTVRIGSDARIHPTVSIEGPALIGDRCRIAQGCRIGSGTVIGADVCLEKGAQIEGSLVMDGVRVGANARLLHSVVGNRCRIGSRVTTVSANSDGSTIQSVIKGKAIDSKRRYLGAIIADDSVIGDRCTVNAGVKIWPNQRVAADSELVIDSMPDPAVWG